MKRIPIVSLCALFACAPECSSAIEASGGITTVTQRIGSSGDFSASGDLFVAQPWHSGEFLLYLEAATTTSADSIFNNYPEINADAGSAQDARGGGRLQISEFNYRFVLGDGSEITIGQVDPSAYLDRSRIANDENLHFIGASFVNNATIQFPDYTLGVVYRRTGNERIPTWTTVIAASDGLADNPGRSYRELIDLGSDGKGLFIGSGVRWTIGATRVGFGGWLRTDAHEKLADKNQDAMNFGLYAVYGRSAGRHGVSLRAGFASPVVSPAAGFFGIAYEYQPRVGLFGIGLAHIVQAPDRDLPTTGNTTHIETFYRFPLLAPYAHLTASLQYVRNPGFDAAAAVADRNAIVAGLRLHAGFGQ